MVSTGAQTGVPSQLRTHGLQEHRNKQQADLGAYFKSTQEFEETSKRHSFQGNAEERRPL